MCYERHELVKNWIEDVAVIEGQFFFSKGWLTEKLLAHLSDTQAASACVCKAEPFQPDALVHDQPQVRCNILCNLCNFGLSNILV